MLTPHAQQRMKERNVSISDIEYCIRHGNVINKVEQRWKVKIVEKNTRLCLIVDRVRHTIVTVYWIH